MDNSQSQTIIIGAGPAGLAAAHKLTENSRKVMVFERDSLVGGLSKTINFKGYRFDIGGHRFFTKSKKVEKIWKETLKDDFLRRPRLSRIYYQNKFFNYPIKPSDAFRKLGVLVSLKILLSYVNSKIFPYIQEKTFEQWVSNRFGKELYKIFFKTYTEKLWGIPCSKIQAEWAAQRIRGLSLFSIVKNALIPGHPGRIKTLIDEFYYPKYGPGMMYAKMAENISLAGGEVFLENRVEKIYHANNRITSVSICDKENNLFEYAADHFISSMPITKLIGALTPVAPSQVLAAAENLSFRSFVSVNLILKSAIKITDNWIYVHSPNVKLGRIQIYKNWSPFMVPVDSSNVSLGLEYFCTEDDEFWNMPDEELINFGLTELEKIRLAKKSDLIDGFVCRMSKAYPIYDEYCFQNIQIIRNYLKQFQNIQLVGRYGMFKYNNMDHSILTGMAAAENILGKNYDIWKINTDDEYQEGKNKY